MMLEVQLEQENDFENPSSNAESEDENDLPDPTLTKKRFQCLICDSRFA